MAGFSIAFTGDIAFSRHFQEAASLAELIDEPIRRFLSEADHGVGNIEGPVDGGLHSAGGEFVHATDIRYAEELKELGIDIWNLANNHALDSGKAGLEETLKAAGQLQCLTVGAGSSKEAAESFLSFSQAGGIGLFSLSYGELDMKQKEGCYYADWDRRVDIQRTIRTIKNNHRWCVAVVHGGDEFSDMPMPYTRRRYMEFLQWGADIVVGHHPHVVQPYEPLGNKIIFYSLGNFIFDTDYQRVQPHTEIGELLKIRFREEGFDWTHQPIRIDRERRSIVSGEMPPVFSSITEEAYARLWPLAAREMLLRHRQRDLYLHPDRYGKYNTALWQLRELYGCRKKEIRCRVSGKIKAALVRSKAENPGLVRYLCTGRRSQSERSKE